MKKPSTRTLAVASAALLTFAGGAYAVAGGSAPTAITSSVTDKLGEAISAKYPGATIVGIRSISGGGYEVELRKSDATEVHVNLDENYKITGEHAGGRGRGMGGPGGKGGHGGMGHRGGRGVDTAALAKELGVSESKLTDALGKVRDATDPRADFAAALAKTLGADVKDVQAVLDAQRAAGGGRGDHHGGPRGGKDELVAALAKKLGVSESKVQDAIDAARPEKSDRREAFAKALAKELGVDASKVSKALEAQRP